MESIVQERGRFILWALGIVGWCVKYGTVFVIAAAVPIVLSYYIMAGYSIARGVVVNKWDSLIASVTKVQVVQQFVEPVEVPLEKRVEMLARKYRVPLVAARALVFKESTNGKNKFRFEEGAYRQLKAENPKWDDSFVRAMASSHGDAHVMGYNAKPECGMEWSELYDPFKGLDCGLKYFRKCLDRSGSIKDPGKRLWSAFRLYNGSGTAAETYADDAMRTVGMLLFADISAEM